MGTPLPPGWRSAIDPKHNREYYFDQSGNVQWTVPTAAPAPAAAAAPAAAPAAAATESSTPAAAATPAADVATPSPAAAAPAASGEQSLFKQPKRKKSVPFSGLFAVLPEELVERVAIAACYESVEPVAYLCRLERAWAELLSSNAVWEAPTVARFPVLRRLLQAASPPAGFRFRHFYFCSLCLLRDTIEAWDDPRQHSDYGWLGSLRVVDEEGHLRLRPSQPPPGRSLQDLLFSIEVTFDGSVCGSWQGFLSATPGQSEQALRPAHDGACDINSVSWRHDQDDLTSAPPDAPSPVAWELPVFDGYPWPSFFPEDALEEVDFTKARPPDHCPPYHPASHHPTTPCVPPHSRLAYYGLYLPRDTHAVCPYCGSPHHGYTRRAPGAPARGGEQPGHLPLVRAHEQHAHAAPARFQPAHPRVRRLGLRRRQHAVHARQGAQVRVRVRASLP